MKQGQLSSALVDKIHAANIANIARKVQEKKTLTSVEMNQLNEARRNAGQDMKALANSVISEGLAVMNEIRGIIEKSKLSAGDKREIYRKISSITIQCTED